jgi:hypothetical protein
MFKRRRNQPIEAAEAVMRFKFIALFIFWLLFLPASHAQKIFRNAAIVAGEYFIGKDPGKGKGTSISIGNSGGGQMWKFPISYCKPTKRSTFASKMPTVTGRRRVG